MEHPVACTGIKLGSAPVDQLPACSLLYLLVLPYGRRTANLMALRYVPRCVYCVLQALYNCTYNMLLLLRWKTKEDIRFFSFKNCIAEVHSIGMRDRKNIKKKEKLRAPSRFSTEKFILKLIQTSEGISPNKERILYKNHPNDSTKILTNLCQQQKSKNKKKGQTTHRNLDTSLIYVYSEIVYLIIERIVVSHSC